MSQIESTYLHQPLEGRLKEITSCAVRHLLSKVHSFEAIAFRGMSGALVAPMIASELEKQLIMVRKTEPSHTYRKVEGAKASRYMIVDDLISSGDTIREIIRSIAVFHAEAKCVGILLWNETKGVRISFEFEESEIPCYPIRKDWDDWSTIV